MHARTHARTHTYIHAYIREITRYVVMCVRWGMLLVFGLCVRV